MLKTLTTLFAASRFRAEERLRDGVAIELIDQKIREAEAQQRAAKATLAGLIQRQRSEARARDGLAARHADLVARTRSALAAGNEALAREAATALVQMEIELARRTETCERLDAKVLRLRGTVEACHRRIVDLRQGAVQARAIRREQDLQARLGDDSAIAEAEALIARVLTRDDPFERTEILRDLDRDLSHETLADRMADAGHGTATRITPEQVLDRLRAEP